MSKCRLFVAIGNIKADTSCLYAPPAGGVQANRGRPSGLPFLYAPRGGEYTQKHHQEHYNVLRVIYNRDVRRQRGELRHPLCVTRDGHSCQKVGEKR